MAHLTSLLLVLLLVCGYYEGCSSEEESKFEITKYMGYAGNAIKFGKALYEGIETIYHKLQTKTTKESESDQKLDSGMEQRLTEQIKHVSKKLDSLKVNMQNMKDEIIDKITNEIPDQINLQYNLNEIYLRINQIENLYESFVVYISSPQNFSNDTLKQFAKAVTSHELTEIPNVIKTIHWFLVQTDANVGDSVLTILSRSSRVPTQMCKTQQPLQQMIYNLYNAIALADIKAYSMIQFGHLILQSVRGDERTSEIQAAEQAFVNRITNTLRAVKKAMKPASREIWTCDTYGHKEDVTYTKLNNVFQKYIINEVDVNADRTCSKTCPAYQQGKVYGCYDNKICAQQRSCDGNLWDCEYKISTTQYICPSNKESNRRYEYIEYGNSQRYGPKGHCSNSIVEIASWNYFPNECSYCLCTCDDKNYRNSDRYVNLRSVTAHINQNYVVTGVRFRKSNNIIHLQIQEGKLLAEGRIDKTTVRWVPIVDYKINEPIPGTEGTKWEYVPQKDVDYHILEWKVKRGNNINDRYMYRKNAINLDDLDFANQESVDHSNFVVGGFRFQTNEVMGSGYHLNLQVHMVPFNYTTGQLEVMSKSYDFASYTNVDGREKLVSINDKTEIDLQNLDIPINSGASAVPVSQTNQFLYLTTSGLEADVGQNVIPFIDLKPVLTNPPMPLSGAGIFHKSSPGSGGFLSLKLFTYDYSTQMQVNDY